LQEYMADHSLADSFKERVSLQRGALARLLKDVAGWRSGAESSPHESEPDSRGSSTGHSRRRRLREALRARRVPSVQELAGLARGKASALSLKASALSDKVQRVMTSSKVRQYWAEQRNKPAVVRLLDKFSFLFGCLTLTGSEYVLCRYPSLFWAWYLFFMSVMLSSRVPDYRRKNWGYFLLDFCYFAQGKTCFLGQCIPSLLFGGVGGLHMLYLGDALSMAKHFTLFFFVLVLSSSFPSIDSPHFYFSYLYLFFWGGRAISLQLHPDPLLPRQLLLLQGSMAELVPYMHLDSWHVFFPLKYDNGSSPHETL